MEQQIWFIRNMMSLQMSVWTQIYIIEEGQMADMIEIDYILEPQNDLTAFLKEIKIEQFEIIQVVTCFTKSWNPLVLKKYWCINSRVGPHSWVNYISWAMNIASSIGSSSL